MNTGTIFDVAYLNEDNADLRLGQIELGDGTVASVPIHKGKDDDYVYFPKKQLLIPLDIVKFHVEGDDLAALYADKEKPIHKKIWVARKSKKVKDGVLADPYSDKSKPDVRFSVQLLTDLAVKGRGDKAEIPIAGNDDHRQHWVDALTFLLKSQAQEERTGGTSGAFPFRWAALPSNPNLTVYIRPLPLTEKWDPEAWLALFTKARGTLKFKVELWPKGTNDPGMGDKRRVLVGVNPFNLYLMYMTSSDLQRLNIAEQPLVDTIATVEHHTVASDKPVNDSKDVRTFWRKYPDQKGAEDARKLISALSADDPTYGSKKRGKIKLTFTHETVRSKINRNRSRDQKEVMDGKSAAEIAAKLWGGSDTDYSKQFEWTHLSAFSYGAFADGEDVSESQVKPNLVFGTESCNTHMLRVEHCLKTILALEARAALFLQNVEQHRDKGQPIIKGGSKNYSATPKAAAFDFKTTARISLTVRRVFDGDLQRLTLDGTPISYPLSGQWWNKLDKPVGSDSTIARTYPWFAPYLRYTASLHSFKALFPKEDKVFPYNFDLFSLHRPTFFESRLDALVMQEYVAELVNKHAISKGYLLGTAKQAWYKFNPQKSNFDDLEEMLKVSPINLEQFFEDRPQDRPSNPLKREFSQLDDEKDDQEKTLQKKKVNHDGVDNISQDDPMDGSGHELKYNPMDG